ncbi:MAG: DUF5655 domain-containing protein [Actinomycetes bacterium]
MPALSPTEHDPLITVGNDTPPAVVAFFSDCPLGLQTYERVCSMLEPRGPFSVRVTDSQVTFRRRRGIAYLWCPDRWLSDPSADVVLSIALPQAHRSVRFKQIAHPTPHVWMHHLEIVDETALDAQVDEWLAEAWSAAR